MTLDAIKNEITARLREVRADSSQFNLSENSQDLQKLITKAIGKVELCETAEDLESIDGILTTIEELYNACFSEESGDPSAESLFEFEFELDEEETEDGEDEEYEEDEVNTEDYVKPEKSSRSNDNAVRRSERKADKKLTKAELYESAKENFDEKCPPSVMKKPNLARLCVGLVALISGVISGLITAQWWPFEWWSWSIIGVGISYLLIALIYAIVIAVGHRSATRRMSFTRLILAGVAVIVSLVLGVIFEFDITIPGAYLATVPFTVCGAFSYVIYRIRIFFIACKLKKQKKNIKKKNV